MKQRIVMDSNVLVALADEKDKWHNRAKAFAETLQRDSVDVIYFDCVLNETISVLARRSEEQKRADDFKFLLEELKKMVPEEAITWVSGEAQRLYNQILDLVLQTGGGMNFHDALIA